MSDHPFQRALRSLEDAYYAVNPTRRTSVVQRCRAAIGRHLEPDHQALKDFDAHQHFGPRSLANIAKVNRVTYLRPWEYVTHLFRSVFIFEYMLSYWLVCQRWMPTRVLHFALIHLTLECNAWRWNLSVEAQTVRVPSYLVPLLVAHTQDQPLAVNVNRAGWGWTKPEWWRAKMPATEGEPPERVDLLPYAVAALMLFSFAFPDPATAGVSLAALSASTVWEIRTAGTATNGAGFVTGAAGTNYSQQDTKNTTGADISTTDAVGIGTTTLTSVTANFGTTIVGNIIYLQGGTGSLAAGWYQVTARASTTSITLDRTVATGTGITMNIGGALSDPALVSAVLVTGNDVHQKTGTYSITSASTNVAGGCVNSSRATVLWEGYAVTRGDLGTAPTFSASGISSATLFATTGNDFTICNVLFDGNGLTSIIGTNLDSVRSTAILVTVRECTSYSLLLSGTAINCRTTAGANIVTLWANLRCFGSVAHDSTILGMQSPLISFSIADTNTGASSDGVFCMNNGLLHNVVSYGNGRDGFRMEDQLPRGINLLAESNGRYGYLPTTTTMLWNWGAYNNTSGAIYPGVLKRSFTPMITGTASFFVDAPNGNFALNNTAGGGALARAAGIPGVFPGGLTTGYQDVGAAQHQDPTSGAPGSAGAFA